MECRYGENWLTQTEDGECGMGNKVSDYFQIMKQTRYKIDIGSLFMVKDNVLRLIDYYYHNFRNKIKHYHQPQ